MAANEPKPDDSAPMRSAIEDGESQQTSTRGPERGRGYRVQLDLFEGPLDLLLHLIKKNEVDVTNIPVAAITEQYLSYIELMRELNLDVAGEYLVMAATLTLVKSRMLLPSAEPDEDEEADPRADLIRQLLEYQRYREAAESLAQRPILRRDVFAREPGVDGLEPLEGAPPNVKATVWQLMESFRAILKRTAPPPVHDIQLEPVSLRERISGVLKTLSVAKRVTFDSLFDDSSSRLHVIVTFLAVLELMKMGAIEAVQEEQFGGIMVVLAIEDIERVNVGLAEEYDGGLFMSEIDKSAHTELSEEVEVIEEDVGADDLAEEIAKLDAAISESDIAPEEPPLEEPETEDDSTENEKP